jgi:ADP-ribose pyrophosphatase YjhB (NUDIX family)
MRTVIPDNANFVPEGATRVFTGIIYDVYQWPQERFDGSIATFEMLKRPDTVEVLAIKDGKIVAIIDEQPTRKPELTLPGGRHNVPTETELDCAKRELHEETGMRFKNWRLVAATQPLHKIEQVVYIFLATGFEGQDKPHVDEGGERIEVRMMDFAEAKQIAEEGSKRYWPNQLLRSVASLDELLDLPQIK